MPMQMRSHPMLDGKPMSQTPSAPGENGHVPPGPVQNGHAPEAQGEDGHAERDAAIVLITDGEDHESFPIEAAAAARERGVKVFTVGIGDPEEGSRVPAPRPMKTWRMVGSQATALAPLRPVPPCATGRAAQGERPHLDCRERWLTRRLLSVNAK